MIEASLAKPLDLEEGAIVDHRREALIHAFAKDGSIGREDEAGVSPSPEQGL